MGSLSPNRPGDGKFWVNAATRTCAGILLFDRCRIFRLRLVDPLMIGTFRSQHNTCSVPAWHKDLRLERLGDGYTICSGRAAKTITQTDWAGRTQRFPHTDNPLLKSELKSEFSEKAPDLILTRNRVFGRRHQLHSSEDPVHHSGSCQKGSESSG